MAPNVGRWWKYAQAKLNDALASGHRELDELEAEQAADVADRPWLASDAEAPTLDEARARIEWEARPAPNDDATSARIELDRRTAESKARLEAIRKELGVDPPEAGPP